MDDILPFFNHAANVIEVVVQGTEKVTELMKMSGDGSTGTGVLEKINPGSRVYGEAFGLTWDQNWGETWLFPRRFHENGGNEALGRLFEVEGTRMGEEGFIKEGECNVHEPQEQMHPFDMSLFPEDRRVALLIGISYPDTDCELKGSANSIGHMYRFLVESMGFTTSSIIILTDNEDVAANLGVSLVLPTAENIVAAMRFVAQGSGKGEIEDRSCGVVFAYSGHSTLAGGMIPAIVPCDADRRGVLTEATIRKLFFAELHPHTKCMAFMDCSHQGRFADMSHQWVSGSDNFEHLSELSCGADIRMISACHEVGEPDDALPTHAGGVLTSFLDLFPRGFCSATLFVHNMESLMRQRSGARVPVLSSTRPLNMATPLRMHEWGLAMHVASLMGAFRGTVPSSCLPVAHYSGHSVHELISMGPKVGDIPEGKAPVPQQREECKQVIKPVGDGSVYYLSSTLEPGRDRGTSITCIRPRGFELYARTSREARNFL